MFRKNIFFEGWFWIKFNILGLALGMVLQFYTSVAKRIKLKGRKLWGLIPTFLEVTWKKLVWGPLFHLILNKVKGHKPHFWISVNLSDTFKTHMKQDKQSFCVTISRREKDGTQPMISYMMYLIMVDMGFSLVSAKFKWRILFLRICDATNMVIYHAVTIEKSVRIKGTRCSFTFYLVIKKVLGILKWLKETSFYERKKETILT